MNKQLLIDALNDVVSNRFSNANLVKQEITEEGFFCDFDIPEPLNKQNFEDIVKMMCEKNIKGFYELKSFSGVYGEDVNESSDMKKVLQRIYVIAFDNEDDFLSYKQLLEEAAERDHKLLGNRMKLYSSSDDIGQGLILWNPKGSAIRFALEQFGQSAHMMNGYQWVYTPHIGRAKLWETSGHLQFYKDSMYNPISIDTEEYYLKPMNCPFHISIYNNEVRSYRDLPYRMAEYGTVYRYELSGTLNGLTRVRGFTQDDAHIICTPEQIENEVINALKFSLYILRSFGLIDFKAYISTKPKVKSIGTDEDWEIATILLKKAIVAAGLEYDIDEGGGAFYGPKIDIKLMDSLKREWQCSTIQFDFNLPERFDMYYIGQDGRKHTPYMIHRALFGSIERFVALLIEHFKGDFPLWFAPVQFGIIPIRESHNEYCRKLAVSMKKLGLRVEVNDSETHMREKIKRNEIEKLPYSLVVGDKDVTGGGFSVRGRKKGDLGFMTLDGLMEHVYEDLAQGKPKYIFE